MEDLEVLGRTGELVNEEHERLRQLEVNLNRCWDPATAPGAQRSWLRPGRGYCKGREDARGLLATPPPQAEQVGLQGSGPRRRLRRLEGEVPGGASGSGARGGSISASKAKGGPSAPGASAVWV